MAKAAKQREAKYFVFKTTSENKAELAGYLNAYEDTKVIGDWTILEERRNTVDGMVIKIEYKGRFSRKLDEGINFHFSGKRIR